MPMVAGAAASDLAAIQPDYQSWMLAEVGAMDKALADKTSTEHL